MRLSFLPVSVRPNLEWAVQFPTLYLKSDTDKQMLIFQMTEEYRCLRGKETCVCVCLCMCTRVSRYLVSDMGRGCGKRPGKMPGDPRSIQVAAHMSPSQALRGAFPSPLERAAPLPGACVSLACSVSSVMISNS